MGKLITSIVDWQNGVSTTVSYSLILIFNLDSVPLNKDQMCFYMNKTRENYLNRFGIIRLLNVISSQSPSFNLHKNWDDIMTRESNGYIDFEKQNHTTSYTLVNFSHPRVHRKPKVNRDDQPRRAYLTHQAQA